MKEESMLDLEILELQGAKFVSIPKGTKAPKIANWHKNTKSFNEFDFTCENIGIVLGKDGGGIVAIDFDGPSALVFFKELFNIEVPETVAFTSTRLGRHQRLFKITDEFYDYLSLKQIKTGVIDEYNKHEQLELRGGFDKAAQSVLPPSFVVDNLGERTYKWLDNLSPQDVLIADLPEEVLVYWLTICNDLEEKPVEQIEIPHNDDMIAHLAETLHQYYPILNYDEWIRVSWAFKNSAGEQIASDLMRYYYPEKQKGEYKKLFRSQPGGKKCTLGTIRYMIKKAGGVCANNESEIKMCELMNKTTKKHQ